MAAAGAQPRADRPPDGINVIGEIVAGKPRQPRTLFWRARRANRTWRAVRDGHLKYVSLQDGDDVREHVYDVANDPGETRDLRKVDKTNYRRLKNLLAGWEKEMKESSQAAVNPAPRP
jgi:N-acetylgalactosamine-6-sulfatase